MSLTRISGERISTTGHLTLYTGRGRLTGILVSNDNAAVQDLTFYDGVNIILLIHVHPALAPIYISFTEAGGKLETLTLRLANHANPVHPCCLLFSPRSQRLAPSSLGRGEYPSPFRRFYPLRPIPALMVSPVKVLLRALRGEKGFSILPILFIPVVR